MKIIFFDIEANGYQKVETRETLQIGAIKCDYETGETEYFNELILPTKYTQVTRHCFEITGIRNKEVMNKGKTFEEVIELFREFARNSCIISWDEFDYKQLNKDCDLRKIERLFSKESNIKYINFQKVFQLKNGVAKKPSLIKTLQQYELSFDKRIHSALTDSLNLKELFDITNSIGTIKKILNYEKLFLTRSVDDENCSLIGIENTDSVFRIKFEEKIDDEKKSIITNSMIYISEEEYAQKIIPFLNKNNIWEEVYIVNY